MITIPIGGGYSAEFRDDGIAISHEDGGLHMAGDPERAMVAEIQRLRADLDEAVEAMHVLAEHADLSDDYQYSTLGTKFVRQIISPILAKHGASDAPA